MSITHVYLFHESFDKVKAENPSPLLQHACPRPFTRLIHATMRRRGRPTAWCYILALGILFPCQVTANGNAGKQVDINEAQRPPGIQGTALSGHDAVVALANRGGIMCSGVVIAQQVVLTAGHCRGATHVLAGAGPSARLGRASVQRFVNHPSRGVDLGLAILDSPLAVTPYGLVEGEVQTGSARVLGFGCEDSRNCFNLGRRTYFDVTLSPHESSCSYDRSSELGCYPTTEMVLRRDVGADTCRGDSGGPLLVRHKETWLVAAITSRGLAHTERPCGEGGVYTRVAPQLNWIQEHLIVAAQQSRPSIRTQEHEK